MDRHGIFCLLAGRKRLPNAGPRAKQIAAHHARQGSSKVHAAIHGDAAAAVAERLECWFKSRLSAGAEKEDGGGVQYVGELGGGACVCMCVLVVELGRADGHGGGQRMGWPGNEWVDTQLLLARGVA